MRRSDRAVEVIAPGGHLGFCVGWPAWPLSWVAAQPPWLRARVRDSVMELVGADPAAHTLWRNTRSCPRLTRTGRTRRGCSTQRVDFGGAAIGSGSLRCTRTAVLPHHRFPISLACQSPAGGVGRPARQQSEALRVNGIDNFIGRRATFDLGDDRLVDMYGCQLRWE